ncbi:hypothetical protein ALC62_04744, partial [Cyphomyrmex costatus]
LVCTCTQPHRFFLCFFFFFFYTTRRVSHVEVRCVNKGLTEDSPICIKRIFKISRTRLLHDRRNNDEETPANVRRLLPRTRNAITTSSIYTVFPRASGNRCKDYRRGIEDLSAPDENICKNFIAKRKRATLCTSRAYFIQSSVNCTTNKIKMDQFAVYFTFSLILVLAFLKIKK